MKKMRTSQNTDKKSKELLIQSIAVAVSIVCLFFSIYSLNLTKRIEQGNRVAETYTAAIESLEKLSFYNFVGEQTGDYTLNFLEDKKIDDQFIFSYCEECVAIKAKLEVLGKEEYAATYWNIIQNIISEQHIYDGDKVEELIQLFRDDLM